MENRAPDTHNVPFGYLLWIFGFTGAHRFYYGKAITGTIWFCTLGLLGVGWVVDLFLIPGMERRADARNIPGPFDFTITWILCTFLGLFGVHRMYLGKWVTGVIWFFTGGLFLVGYVYYYWTLNEQISEANARGGNAFGLR